MVKISGIVSLVVFVLSTTVHFATFVPSISGSTLDDLWPLHFATMVVFATMVFFIVSQLKRQPKKPIEIVSGNNHSSRQKNIEFQRRVISLIPVPLRILCLVVFLYAVGSSSWISFHEEETPTVKKRQYYLNDLGQTLQDLSKEEPEPGRFFNARSASGYWMFFSLIPTIYFLVVHPRLEESPKKVQAGITGNILDDLLTSPPPQRYQNLRNSEFLKALEELETD